MAMVSTPIVPDRSRRWVRRATAIAQSSSGVWFCGRLGLCRGDRGASSTEYALMVSLIALVIIGAVTLFGQNMVGLFNVPAAAL